MEIQENLNLKRKNSLLIKSLLFFLCIFLIVLTVFTGIEIQNKLKEGKYIGQQLESRNSITVSGTGEVYTKPDLGLISLSVITEKKTVGEAIEKNAEKMNEVIEEMKNQEIEEKDLKTTNFSIYPRYEWQETEAYPKGERILVGYEAYQTLEVKVRDIDKIGEIIKKATEKGANQVGNLQFTVENEEEVKKQARGEAIKKAKSKAEGIASQIGVSLVKIINFGEGEVAFPRFYNAIDDEVVGMGGESPKIEIGENKIEVTVSITYEIN